MPRRAAPLSALAVSRLGRDGFHPVGDVPGLGLSVSGNARSWLLRFSLAGRRPEMGLGSYPELSLAVARQKAKDARELTREQPPPNDWDKPPSGRDDPNAKPKPPKPRGDVLLKLPLDCVRYVAALGALCGRRWTVRYALKGLQAWANAASLGDTFLENLRTDRLSGADCRQRPTYQGSIKWPGPTSRAARASRSATAMAGLSRSNF